MEIETLERAGIIGKIVIIKASGKLGKDEQHTNLASMRINAAFALAFTQQLVGKLPSHVNYLLDVSKLDFVNPLFIDGIEQAIIAAEKTGQKIRLLLSAEMITRYPLQCLYLRDKISFFADEAKALANF